jgi:hypothetical protein
MLGRGANTSATTGEPESRLLAVTALRPLEDWWELATLARDRDVSGGGGAGVGRENREVRLTLGGVGVGSSFGVPCGVRFGGAPSIEGRGLPHPRNRR